MTIRNIKNVFEALDHSSIVVLFDILNHWGIGDELQNRGGEIRKTNGL